MGRWLVVVGLCLCLPMGVQAARTLSAEQPLSVKLEATQPTAVAFPEPVASVTVGLEEQQISVDYDGPYLFLIARDPTITGRLFIVGQSGKLYILVFKVATPPDDILHITATAPSTPPAPAFSATAFLRALRTRTPVPGQQPADMPPPVFADPRVLLTDVQALAVGPQIGMTLILSNPGFEPLPLDVRIGVEAEPPDAATIRLATWTFPPRVTVKAVAADDEVVPPGGQTRVYLILQRRP